MAALKKAGAKNGLAYQAPKLPDVLVALAESKAVPVRDRAYRRGVECLLSTQFPDWSWHVRSRAIKFQPYFESGFPFGHDQWISTAGPAAVSGSR